MTDDFNPTKWITTNEAAELTGYDVRYLRQLVNEGKIKAVKRSRVIFIDKDSVLAYTNQMKRLGPAKHDPWRTGARKRNDRAD
jgi:excisionase family DNA binding protein